VLASVPDARRRDDVLGQYLRGVREATHLTEEEKDAIIQRNENAHWYDPDDLSSWWRDRGAIPTVRPLGPRDPNASDRYHLVVDT
jgi:hypothetical protein